MKNWKFSEYLLGLCVLVILLTGGATLYLWNDLPPLVPFLYSLPWGEQQLIRKEFFAGGLIVILLLNIINYFLAKKLIKDDEVISRTISGSSFLMTFIYLTSYWEVVIIIK